MKYNGIHLGEAIRVFDSGDLPGALALFQEAADKDPNDWIAWYWIGQCNRYFERFDKAIHFLEKACNLHPDDKSEQLAPVLLALGIAYQLAEEYEKSVEALTKSIELDQRYDPAYNSLGLTYLKMGNADSALEAFDEGLRTITLRVIDHMENRRDNKIIKHRDTKNHLWIELVLKAGLYLSVRDGKDGAGWPTDEMAIEEEELETHAGLFWTDIQDNDGQETRLFLPNFFNTLRENFKTDSSYAHLTDNKGMALERLGRVEEAKQHYAEAEEFLPPPNFPYKT